MNRQQFVKTYPALPPEGVTLLFQKYQRIEATAAHIVDMVVPHPISHDAHSITFEQIDFSCWTPIIHHFSQSRTVAQQLQFRVGSQLAQLHAGIEPFVHGDLWPGNIFCHAQTDELLWIDFEPIHNRTDWIHALQGIQIHDLAQWIALSETLLPLERWYRYPLCRRSWYDAFLKGYQAAGATYDADILAQRVQQLFTNNTTKMTKKKSYSLIRRWLVVSYRILTRMCNPYLRSVRPYQLQKADTS